MSIRTDSDELFWIDSARSDQLRGHMGAQTNAKSKPKHATKNQTAPRICWFEIPADNPERAKKFYGSLFGWNIKKFPGVEDYWHIDTGGGEDAPDGGLMARKYPAQPITNQVDVSSTAKASARVEKLGGTICKSKTAIPHMGYFAVCQDMEGNECAPWGRNDRAR